MKPKANEPTIMNKFEIARDVFAGIGFGVSYLLVCFVVAKLLYLLISA